MKTKKLIQEINEQHVLEDFGNEWLAYKQNCLSENELESSYNAYFSIFRKKSQSAGLGNAWEPSKLISPISVRRFTGVRW